MSEGISDSRFNMWRAVVALVHADGVVTEEECELVENYLQTVGFSEEQKATLLGDLSTAQDAGEMFEKISSLEDRGDFFSFARLIVQADGTIDRQEEEIFERLRGKQMGAVGEDRMRDMVRQARKEFDSARRNEDAQFRREAKDLVGLRKIFTRTRGAAA